MYVEWIVGGENESGNNSVAYNKLLVPFGELSSLTETQSWLVRKLVVSVPFRGTIFLNYKKESILPQFTEFPSPFGELSSLTNGESI